MDRWAVRYAGRASFVCASCDGPDLAEKFASELRLAHCLNVWVDPGGMPSWGQLGCQGFIVCDGRGAVTCKATSAFLDVDDRAFRHVEALLEALVADEGEGGPDAAAGGRCLVRTADGSNLKVVDAIPQRGGCAGCNCGDKTTSDQKAACDEETGAENGTEEKRKATAGTTEEGPAAQEEDAGEAARAHNVPPVAVADPAAPAKREAFKGVMSLGVCANDLCFCADCECGRGCTCNVASQGVEQQETCDPCEDFRRQKKAAGGDAPAAAPSCADSGAAAVDAPAARK